MYHFISIARAIMVLILEGLSRYIPDSPSMQSSHLLPQCPLLSLCLSEYSTRAVVFELRQVQDAVARLDRWQNGQIQRNGV